MTESDADTDSARMRQLAALDRSHVTPGVRIAAEWSWRLILIAAAGYGLLRLFLAFEEVFVPVALAVLVSAMLVPVVDSLDRRGVPRSLAVIGTMVASIGALAAVLTFVVREFIHGVPELAEQVRVTVDRTKQWLVEGPLHLESEQVRNVGSDLLDMVQRNQDKVTSGALATATTVGEIVTGAFLTVFLLIFFLYGGGQIWGFLVKVVPGAHRERVRTAGVAGFGTLVGYVRATVVVALVDAVGIGIGLAILQVPLALPLASLVFLGAFIPIVGALASGSLAVVVALVTQGWIAAAITLAIVVGVMQLESHVLQPFLLGRSVRLHPVAVVLGIATGIVFSGIIGGLLAVPLIAFLNTAIRHLNRSAQPAVVTEGGSGDGGSGDGGSGDGGRGEGMYHAEPDSPRWDEYDGPQNLAAETGDIEGVGADPKSGTDAPDRDCSD